MRKTIRNNTIIFNNYLKNLHTNFNSTIQKVVLLFFFLTVFPKSAHAQVKEWGDCVIDGVPSLKCIEVVFGNLLFISNVFIIFVLFIMFVIGSFKFLTSLGNPEQVEGAKGTFKWALIGLGLYLSSYLILTLIDIIFLGGKGTIFQFRIGD